jgi:hypothetical protein
MKEQFEGQMLRVHFGEKDKWDGKPLHEAVVDKCLELGLAGAIVYRGIEGFGASTAIRRSSLWSLSSDAPIMVSVIDRAEAIEKLIPHLDAMVTEGLVAVSRVSVIRYSQQVVDPERELGGEKSR